MKYMPILEVTRGGVVESIHYGAFVVADSHGGILQSWGSVDVVTFLRSSAKPFQAIPLIEAGGVEQFGFSEKQLALMCASHTGSDEHVAIAKSIQELIGATEEMLVCGTHPPSDKEAEYRLIQEGSRPTPNRHNCSGKHSGMLALAILTGESVEGYSEPGHPIQQKIMATFSEMFDLPTENIGIGIDGCSVPTFAVPLHAAATAFARLADPTTFSGERQRACRIVWKAMTNYPEVVGGGGRFDTQVMQVFNGSLLSKGGAEGYQGIAIAPGAIAPDSPALGIALKISDGDQGSRARGFLSVSILRDLGLIEREVPALLSDFGSPNVKNWRKLDVGELRSTYKWKEVA
jgi:L-asparaginase II